MSILTAHDTRVDRLRRSAEDGVALFYALLVVLVVGGIAAVVFATAAGEIRQSAFELDFEDSLHLAEAGLEVVLQELEADSSFSTIGADSDPVLGPLSTDDTFDWAFAAAMERNASDTDYNLPAVDFGEGEAVAIRPSGTDANYAYGIGFHPNRDTFLAGLEAGLESGGYVRVVRAQMGFTDTDVAGQFAVLAGTGIINNSNAYAVGGLNGSIHTNGTLDLSNDNVTGTISYSGDCAKNSICEDDPDVELRSEVALPSRTIDDVWGTQPNPNPISEEIAQAGDWFDYCDGTGRHNPAGGPGWYQRGTNNPAPCTGTKLTGADTPPEGWSGLNFSAVTDPDRVYWVDSATGVSVSKINGAATVISKSDIAFGPSGNDGGMTPRYPGLLLFTEGDVTVSGNNQSSDPDGAIVYAGGDIKLANGSDSVNIAYIAVGDVFLNGSASVSYDGDAVANLGGASKPLLLEWGEVR